MSACSLRMRRRTDASLSRTRLILSSRIAVSVTLLFSLPLLILPSRRAVFRMYASFAVGRTTQTSCEKAVGERAPLLPAAAPEDTEDGGATAGPPGADAEDEGGAVEGTQQHQRSKSVKFGENSIVGIENFRNQSWKPVTPGLDEETLWPPWQPRRGRGTTPKAKNT